MLGRSLQSIAVVLVLAVLGWAQATTPAHLGAETPGLAVQDDPEYKNVLVGSVLAGASYNTRAAYTSTATGGHYTGDIAYLLQPSIALQQSRPTVNWTLSYTPGGSFSQHALDQFQYTQNASGQLVWTPNNRIMLRLRQDYSVSTNPFEQVGRVALLPQLGGLFGPNYQDVLPYTKRTTYVSNAELIFRLGPHTALGFTGGYQQFDYNSLTNNVTVGTPALIPSHTVSGSAFFSQQISQAHTLGVQYAYFDIYSFPESRAQANDVMLFDKWQITARNTVTLFAGPEYVRMHDFVVLPIGPFLVGGQLFSTGWRPMGGLTYEWHGTRNAIQVQGVRSVSSGGGLMGASSMTSGLVGVRSRFSKRWTGNVNLQIADQSNLDTAIKQSFRSVWAGGGLTYDVTRHFSVRIDYAWVRQTGQALLYVPGNQQLVQISLDFHFLKPVGK